MCRPCAASGNRPRSDYEIKAIRMFDGGFMTQAFKNFPASEIVAPGIHFTKAHGQGYENLEMKRIMKL